MRNLYFTFGIAALVSLIFGGRMVEAWEESQDDWRRFDYLFKKYGEKSKVPWQWLKAIALNESNLGREKSVSRGLEAPADIEGSKSYDGLSWGLMQVTVKTGKTLDPLTTPEKLNDPDFSVRLAAEYVRVLMKYFNETDPRFVEWVIKSYNQGPGNTAKERAGKSNGFAGEYWERFKRNLQRVERSP